MMTGFLVAFLGIAFLILTIRDRMFALSVFCALLPSYVLRFGIPVPGTGVILPSTILELLFLILFAVWFVMDGRHSKVWADLGRWWSPLLLLTVGATVGVLISPDLLGAAGLWRAYFIEPFLFLALFVDIVRTPQQRNMVVWALGIALAFTGIIAVIQKITGLWIPNPVWQDPATRRVTGVYGFPNAIGLFAGPLVILLTARAVAFLKDPSIRRRWLFFPAIISATLGALAILFAVSEGAMIGAAAGLLALGLLLPQTRKLALIAIIIGSAIVSFYRPMTSYVATLASLRDDSGSVRRIVWTESLTMLDDHAVFGAGLDGYRATLVPYHAAKHIEIFMYPHSVLLNFWSETGLIGVAGFLWLIGLFLFRVVPHARRPEDWLPQALLAAMIALVVHGLVDVPFLKNDLAFEFVILLGLAAGLELSLPQPFTAKTEHGTVRTR